MLMLSNISTFVFALGFKSIRSVAPLIVMSAFYGGVTGLFFTPQPMVLIRLCPNLKLIWTRVGISL